jgi:hypothetical protein
MGLMISLDFIKSNFAPRPAKKRSDSKPITQLQQVVAEYLMVE